MALEDGDNSTIGAHFEKTVIGDDVMVSSDTMDSRFSKMSLAVAQDSGFYTVDVNEGEHFFWGKGEGCGIADSICADKNVDEFCSKEEALGCSDHHLYRTECAKSQYTGSCMINLNKEWCKLDKKGAEEYLGYGKDSLCQIIDVAISSL